MNRRTLLRGAAIGSIVPATQVGPVTGNGQQRDEISVRIVDVPESIRGGDLLEWAAEITNPTAESVRPTLEYTVDGESVGNVTTTVEPGTTERPFPVSHPTEPVAEQREVEVGVEIETDTDTDADSRTVRLLPVDELDADLLFPDPTRERRVRPGTTVQFEVGAVEVDSDPESAPTPTQTTTWWVDGDRVGDTLADPWQSRYFADQGAHFWQETFDEPGRREVVAGVSVGDEQYRASWTVDVADRADARSSPSIDAARPDPGVLEVAPDEPVELELDVSDPDEALQRVVWWLTQADVILGTSDVSGASDTATLAVDGGLCHTCRIVPWVITADGTFTSAAVWVVDHPDLESPAEGVEDVGLEDDGVSDGPDADDRDVKSGEPTGEKPEPEPEPEPKPDETAKQRSDSGPKSDTGPETDSDCGR